MKDVNCSGELIPSASGEVDGPPNEAIARLNAVQTWSYLASVGGSLRARKFALSEAVESC